MNEQVLKDLYDRAVSKGYQKSIEEFNALLQSNENVLADNYGYVQEKGYQKSLEDFSVLVGVKKKRRFGFSFSAGRYGFYYTTAAGRGYFFGVYHT